MQNLIVRPAADDTKGRFEVVAGGRRLAALQSLAKGKRITKSYPVPCVVREPEAATELSLAENTKRLAMHPADEFEAFRTLADQGHDPAAIALRSGVSTRHVNQRRSDLINVSVHIDRDLERAFERWARTRGGKSAALRALIR